MKMKLIAILLTATFVEAGATGYAQNISLSVKNAPIEKVLRSIERQVDYVFFYDSKDLQKINLTIRLQGTSIQETLKECFRNVPLTYKIVGNTIAVKKKEKGILKASADLPEYFIPPPPIQVRGKITNEKGEGLQGVSVIIKGTQQGTTTDHNGVFSINVPDANAVLMFSFQGYQPSEKVVGNTEFIEMALEEDTKILDEIVVTAFGLEREKKALTYTVQNVETEPLARARELNVINSLSGKVAGLSINRSGSGLGSPSRVILRGNRSINGDSEPLYIIDGVPGFITAINPDDIENISVLKGPNAAALYGSRANNGAIIITTKRGQTGKGFNITLNNTYMVDKPILLTNYQNIYGQGNAGVYAKHAMTNWGAKMDGSMVDHWFNDPAWPTAQYKFEPQPDNVKDFFQTGHNFSTGIGISAGNEKSQVYFSYTYADASGVTPGNELRRHNLNLRLNNKLTEKLSLDAKINYIREDIKNQLAQGFDETNPIYHALPFARNIKTEEAKIFEYIDESGLNRQNFWSPGYIPSNPYWVVNRNPKVNVSDRVNILASLKYQITDNLSLQARSAASRSFSANSTKIYNGSTRNLAIGQFSVGRADDMEWNNDFLLSYHREINSNWAFNLNAGGNSRKRRNSGLSAATSQGLTVPNLFTLGNSQQVQASYNIGGPQDVNSLYGFGQLSFKNSLFLDVTGRNDWSSTLPRSNWSFFYPSIGISAVISDLFSAFPAFISFAKLRTSYAEVGNDTNPFQLERTAFTFAGGRNGFLALNGTLPNANLKPEKTKSIEIGADLRFLQNRLGIDFTYYKTNSLNQLFTVALPVGSGAASFFTNGGDVQNRGIELMISATPVNAGSFRWDLHFNYAKNNSLVKKINDERPIIVVGSDYIRQFRIEQGKPWGEVYARGFVRDAQNRIIVDADGLPRTTTGFDVRVANYNPDWLGGINNSFRYKNISFNFLIDIRKGGSIASITNAVLYGYGLTSETLPGREGGLVFGENFYPHETAINEDGSKNIMAINAEQFWTKVGGQFSPVGEVFTVDASNIRLREAVLGYSLPVGRLSKYSVNNIDISFVARNLFFISNKAGNIDPDVIVGTGKEAQGYDSFAPPSSRSFGLNLEIGF